jgi:hypothetical protein
MLPRRGSATVEFEYLTVAHTVLISSNFQVVKKKGMHCSMMIAQRTALNMKITQR